MKMSKRASNNIASLINSIEVWGHNWRTESDYEKAHKYMIWYYEAVSELADEYGIELPTIELARAELAK